MKIALTRLTRGASFALLCALSCTGSIGDLLNGRSTIDDAPDAPNQLSARVMRLTTAQYRNSISDIFNASVLPNTALDVDDTTQTFSTTGAALIATSRGGVEAYEDAAIEVATKVMTDTIDFSHLDGCAPQAADDPCISAALSYYGMRLWRRPLGDDELANLTAVVTAGGTGSAALQLGLTYALATLMQSPNFLYTTSVGSTPDRTQAHLIDDYEMASRLSYLIWNSTPDEALLAAAAKGTLGDVDGIRTQATRMLEDPRASNLGSRFFGEAWRVNQLASAAKDPSLFPDWNDALSAAYATEFTSVIDDIVKRHDDLLKIIDGSQTFMNDTIANEYGVKVTGDGFVSATLPATRAGLLTSGAVIAANSPANRNSPTRRGVFVREQLLCQPVPPPPPGVDTTPPTQTGSNANLTDRQLAQQHATDPACASCHTFFDPIGLTFENYDAIGSYRTTDVGQAIDASANFDGTPVKNAIDFAHDLRSDARVPACMTQLFIAYATAHQANDANDAVVSAIAADFTKSGFDLAELVTGVVTSDAFRYVITDD